MPGLTSPSSRYSAASTLLTKRLKIRALTVRYFPFVYGNGKLVSPKRTVRNRAKELAELLSDSDRIRQERRKAKVNKQKYKGIEGGSGYGGFSSSSSSRYGGFGSESAGVGGGELLVRLLWYNPFLFLPTPSGYGEDSPSDFYRTSQAGSSTARRDSFEEYDAGDDDDRQPSQPTSSQTKSSSNKPVPAAPKQKEVNLFDFDEEEPTPAPVSKVAASSAPGLDGLSFHFEGHRDRTNSAEQMTLTISSPPPLPPLLLLPLFLLLPLQLPQPHQPTWRQPNPRSST